MRDPLYADPPRRDLIEATQPTDPEQLPVVPHGPSDVGGRVEREGAWSAPGTRTPSRWGSAPVPPAPTAFRCVLRGELDFERRDQLFEIAHAFEASHLARAEIDVSEVSFVDSSALAMLLAMRRTAVDRGGAVVLLHPGRRLRRLLSIAGVSGLFAIDEPRQTL